MISTLPALHKIDPIARTVVDAQFAYAIEELGIAQKSRLNTHHALSNAFRRLDVSQTLQPQPKIFGLANLDHV
jgi:hypothetical protein